MKPIQATGRATVRLTEKSTGRVVREITAKNTLNSDYAAEAKNNIFTASPPLSVFLSDYEQPAPTNGLIFPMGKFLGYGKYNTASSSQYQGTWATNFSKMNVQENGLTTSTLAWDFTEEQAVGTIRSLFLFLDGAITRYPALSTVGGTWAGSPNWSVENKIMELAAKTATAYNVLDLHAKQLVSHAKVNTLTPSGIARDVDNGHIFIFDAAAKKLYEFASLDVDMTAASILHEYPCTGVYCGKGLIKGDNLFYLGTSDPVSTSNATPGGASLYLYRYNYKTQSDSEMIDAISAAEIGAAQFISGNPCLFVDDALVYFQSTAGSGVCPVLRMVGNTPRIGFTGGYSSASTQAIQRISPNKQVLVHGSVVSSSSYPINKIPPMAVSHLLLPEPIIKDAQHRLSVSYTISIQD
jgi:hypothetical protein